MIEIGGVNKKLTSKIRLFFDSLTRTENPYPRHAMWLTRHLLRFVDSHAGCYMLFYTRGRAC